MNTTPTEATTTRPQFRTMSAADVTETARLHARYLPQGLFPRLGHRFLARWHRTFTDTRWAWSGVFVHDGRIVAYVLVAIDPARHRQHALVHHRGPLVRAGLLSLLLRPRLAWSFVRTRGRRYARQARRAWGRGVPSGRTFSSDRPPAVVHALVTGEGHRGLGLASALLDRAAAECARRGAAELALVTGAGGSAGGEGSGPVGFYQRLGWRVVDDRSRDDRRVLELRRSTAPPDRTVPLSETTR